MMCRVEQQAAADEFVLAMDLDGGASGGGEEEDGAGE
jgi:hypothetical protein